ncbi:hypothetical protein HDU96_009085 [Phlyctochytrium bullatum]|nr:hypothetical protein HDU96_009085 [Phlyctochytrium bullatum]
MATSDCALFRTAFPSLATGDASSSTSCCTTTITGAVDIGQVTKDSVICRNGRIVGMYFEEHKTNAQFPANVDVWSEIELLSLPNCGISGSLPASIGNLSKLKWFSLENNAISGSIPSSIGKLAPALLRLILQRNALTGTIPSEIGDLSSLEWLFLDENQLYGPIPVSIANLKITRFGVSGNYLNGAVADSISRITETNLVAAITTSSTTTTATTTSTSSTTSSSTSTSTVASTNSSNSSITAAPSSTAGVSVTAPTSSAPSSSSSIDSSPLSTVTPSSSPPSGPSVPLLAGIAVAGIVILAALGVGTILYLRKMKRDAAKNAALSTPMSGGFGGAPGSLGPTSGGMGAAAEHGKLGYAGHAPSNAGAFSVAGQYGNGPLAAGFAGAPVLSGSPIPPTVVDTARATTPSTMVTNSALAEKMALANAPDSLFHGIDSNADQVYPRYGYLAPASLATASTAAASSSAASNWNGARTSWQNSGKAAVMPAAEQPRWSNQHRDFMGSEKKEGISLGTTHPVAPKRITSIYGNGPSAESPRGVSALTPEQVSEQLLALGVGPALVAALEDHRVDGARLLALDDAHLQAIGIEQPYSRLIILGAAQQVAASNGAISRRLGAPAGGAMGGAEQLPTYTY